MREVAFVERKWVITGCEQRNMRNIKFFARTAMVVTSPRRASHADANLVERASASDTPRSMERKPRGADFGKAKMHQVRTDHS